MPLARSGGHRGGGAGRGLPPGDTPVSPVPRPGVETPAALGALSLPTEVTTVLLLTAGLKLIS